MDIALTVSHSQTDSATAAADSVDTILRRDLDQSDWLRITPQDSATPPIAIVRVTPTTSGLSVALIDARTQRLYRSQTFPLPLPALAVMVEAQRWAIHGIADALLQWITGQPGAAQSRIAYVTKADVHVVDQDGANDHAFPNTGIALSPAWSHDGRTLVYTILTSTGTHLVELDLSHGTATTLTAASGGLNITPVYSPDDRWIVFAHGDDDGINLVALRRDSAAPPRTILHRHGFDNSSPTFSPDGQRIAFISARPKTPQIYSVTTTGTGERLETPFSRAIRSYRASPDWSPDGNTIAFEQQNGNFQLWLLTLATHTMRRITSSGDNQDPSWAPDDRHLAFTAVHNGMKDIWTIDTFTGRLRQVTHNGNARLAAWSPTFAKN